MENSVARKGFENLLPQYRIDGFSRIVKLFYVSNDVKEEANASIDVYSISHVGKERLPPCGHSNRRLRWRNNPCRIWNGNPKDRWDFQ